MGGEARLVLTRKVRQTNLIFGVRSGFISSLCTQNYKSLCAAVMICAILVNIQTRRHKQYFDQLM